jgi:hypothetical protein
LREVRRLWLPVREYFSDIHAPEQVAVVEAICELDTTSLDDKCLENVEVVLALITWASIIRGEELGDT